MMSKEDIKESKESSKLNFEVRIDELKDKKAEQIEAVRHEKRLEMDIMRKDRNHVKDLLERANEKAWNFKYILKRVLLNPNIPLEIRMELVKEIDEAFDNRVD